MPGRGCAAGPAREGRGWCCPYSSPGKTLSLQFRALAAPRAGVQEAKSVPRRPHPGGWSGNFTPVPQFPTSKRGSLTSRVSGGPSSPACDLDLGRGQESPGHCPGPLISWVIRLGRPGRLGRASPGWAAKRRPSDLPSEHGTCCPMWGQGLLRGWLSRGPELSPWGCWALIGTLLRNPEAWAPRGWRRGGQCALREPGKASWRGRH